MIYPPLKSQLSFDGIQVRDEFDKDYVLQDLLTTQSEYVLFMPGFTMCHGVCPVMVQLYKKILSDPQMNKDLTSNLNVFFFSFDSEDTAESLKDFKDQNEFPPHWHILRADANDTQKVLNTLQYTVMKGEDGAFQHPFQTFVFTKHLDWVGSLYGNDVNVKEMTELLNQARMSQSHPFYYSTLKFLNNPNQVVPLAGGALFCFLFVLLYLGIRMGRKTQHNTQA